MTNNSNLLIGWHENLRKVHESFLEQRNKVYLRNLENQTRVDRETALLKAKTDINIMLIRNGLPIIKY